MLSSRYFINNLFSFAFIFRFATSKFVIRLLEFAHSDRVSFFYCSIYCLGAPL